MNRSDSLTLIDSALAAGRTDYAEAMARAWLVSWPGDLAMQYGLARALIVRTPVDPASILPLLDSILAVDVEHAAAHRMLAGLRPEVAIEETAVACALTGRPMPAGMPDPTWLAAARSAVAALAAAKYDTARDLAEAALRDPLAPQLLSLLTLKAHWCNGDDAVALAMPLAEGFHARWPRCIVATLCLAEGCLRVGDSHRAVELLHTAATLDPARDVVRRYWNAARLNQYASLWPQPADVPLPGPIPAEVTTLLGLNRLAGKRAPGKSKSTVPAGKSRKAPAKAAPRPSEELIDIQSALNSVASQISAARYHRQQTHVILYSDKLLRAKFGPQAGAEIVALIEQLAAVVAARRRLPVVLLAPDDPNRLANISKGVQLNAPPVDAANAWAVKMMLHDLDGLFTRKGRSIGSLLIVGGDDLLPFHRLPNPTDDVDNDVPSDNPYGTTDDNYFLPEWPVGRLPSPCGRDAEPLKQILKYTIAAHSASGPHPAKKWIDKFIARLLRRAGPLPSSVGYAASIWKEAALEVYAPIGPARALHTSPPLDTRTAPPTDKQHLAYFNLHGMEDAPDWLGQRDPTADDGGDLYPVAFKPADIRGKGVPASGIVFTEACYGANIINKTEPDAAVCLRFLTNGTRAIVGSTKIAYGSIGAPLIGADLLGRLFWETVLTGAPLGEALRSAKLNLARTMHKRQGFLDGEDQKTLISFVLYGDPLLSSGHSMARPHSRPKALAPVQTMAMDYENDGDVARPETVAEIKTLLARYLPGADTAQVRVARPLPSVAAMAKGNPVAPSHRVYTFSPSRADRQPVQTFARVTVNKAGKVMKVAISR